MTRLKAYFLLAGLTFLLLYFGRFFGGRVGMTVALVLAGAMNFIAYFYSDKLVLSIYRAKPLTLEGAPRLHEMVADLAHRMRMPKPKLYLIPTPHPNAFATGRSPRHASVAVTQGIHELLSERELRGVLAHELSHVKNYDILIGTVAATLAGAIVYLSDIARFALIFGGHGDRDRNGNPLASLALLIVAPLAALLVQMGISRQREYLADETGAQLLRDPLPLADALEKLARETSKRPLNANPATAHLFIVAPFRGKGILSLFSTHPPVAERIRRLRAMARIP